MAPAHLKTLVRQYYKKAADLGNAAAQYEYGLCATKGIGMDIDMVAAFEYFEMAALQKDMEVRPNRPL